MSSKQEKLKPQQHEKEYVNAMGEIWCVSDVIFYRKCRETLQVVVRPAACLVGSELNCCYASAYIKIASIDPSKATFGSILQGDNRSYCATYQMNSHSTREGLLGFHSRYGGDIVTINVEGSIWQDGDLVVTRARNNNLESERKAYYFIMKDCYLVGAHVKCETYKFPVHHDIDESLFASMYSLWPKFIDKCVLTVSKAQGSDEPSLFFVQGGTSITIKNLSVDESIILNVSNLVAWESSVYMRVTQNNSFIFRHNVFFVTAIGPGKVYISTTSRADFWQNETGGVTGNIITFPYDRNTTGQLMLRVALGFLLGYILLQMIVNNFSMILVEPPRDL